MPIIGIDLGTTNSLVSYWIDDGVKIIPNAFGNNLTPSVISVDENAEIFVGQVAKERLITHPHLTAAAFKRYMGTTKVVKLGKYKFLPEELSSLVIRSLKQDAEAYLGETINEAVISVPAYFNDAQRRATKRAGELAGLKVERLINEPSAAAGAYGIHQQKSETKFLIFDLGGGTFDVSIVEIFENVMEVKAIAGDNYLGGEDFTNALLSAFAKHYKMDEKNIEQKIYVAIKKQAELCKQSLSKSTVGTMRCHINGNILEMNVERNEFFTTTKELVNRLRIPVERALKDAEIRADELDSVILVGGATRMPMIHTLVSRLLGRFPSCNLNPDEVVVIGAGIQAAMKERNVVLQEIVLTDVCPYTLGIEVSVSHNTGQHENGHFAPIIERNSTIPVSRVERFYTIADNQTAIVVKIFQGESRLIKNNIYLGEISIKVPPAPAGRQAIDVRFTYDINGILEVEVIVVETGISKRIIIEESPGTISKIDIENRLKALAEFKMHPRERQENQLLVARGERLFEESLGDRRMEIAAILQHFEGVLNRQNDREIKKAAGLFRTKLDELERRQEY